MNDWLFCTEITGKVSGFAGITPPASEVGNDEILAISLDTTDNDKKIVATSLDTTDEDRKRKSRTSTELPIPKSKRPRRTLIDDYITKENGSNNSAGDAEQEEEEFEVQSIVDMKKSQVGASAFHK